MRRIAVERERGRRVFADVWGAGRLVVLPNCHPPWGSPGWTQALADQFQVAVVDLAGFGESDRDERAYGLGSALDDIAAVSAALGKPVYACWGYALMAPLAAWSAARGVPRVVIGGYSPFGMPLRAKRPPSRGEGYFWDGVPMDKAAVAALATDAVDREEALEDALGKWDGRGLLYYAKSDRTKDVARHVRNSSARLNQVGFDLAPVAVPLRARLRRHGAHNALVTIPELSVHVVRPFLTADR